MSDQSQHSQRTDPRIQAALREYLERIDRGELVNREEFLSRHAEIADDLRSFFAAEEPLRKIAATKISNESAAVSTQSIAAQGQETVLPKVRPGASLGTMGSGLAGKFGRYEILRALGKGAMGAVYLAQDTQLKRHVAIKTPHLEEDPTGELLQRFYREAEAAATLRHANICPVYDVGKIDGKHFISMAYIEGRPLSDLIKSGKLQNERHILIAVYKLARALLQAHDRGIVHRDLKPANIMVDKQGEPMIMDFGLARKRRAEGEASLTHSGVILGSPAYMSPEQIEGDPESVGPASDQYSLGVVLYEMLTGQLPFRGSVVNVLAQIITKGPSPPSELRAGLDPRIEAVCLRMMAKKASERFPSMKAVADELATIVKNPATAPVPEPIAAEKSPTASRPPAAPRPTSAEAGASQVGQSLNQRSISPSDVTSIEELVRKCLRRRDYDQMIQIIERIPESRRSEALQTLLDKAREKVDEIAFLICEIDEAVRLKDRQTALRKAEALLTIKPGHHRAKAIQETYAGYGNGAAARIGILRKFTQPWNEGGWIPWGVLAFGLAVFAGMYGVIVISLGNKTAIVIDAKDPGITVEVNDRHATIKVPGEQSIQVEPGDQSVKVSYAGLETVTKSFTLAKGKTKRLTVRLLDNKLMADLEGEMLPTSAGSEKVKNVGTAPAGPNGPSPRTVAAAPPVTPENPPPQKDGFVPLFNGKDLTGWKSHPDDPGDWHVENGVLIGRGPVPNLFFTEREDYTNFRLRVEARINSGGDSGVCFRLPMIDYRKQRVRGNGYEAQINNGPPQGNSSLTGSLMHLDGTAITDVLVPPREWFTLDVAVEDYHVVIKVNEKKTVDFVDPAKLYQSGHIAVQVLAPSTVVEFRKIEIKELPAASSSTSVPNKDADRRAAEWVLSVGGGIKIDESGNGRDIKAGGNLPRGAFELTGALLSGNPKVTDAGLACFKDCNSVNDLNLWNTHVSDAGLPYFKDCRKLTSLGLYGNAKVSDAGLAYFKDCENLTGLDVGLTQVSDAGLAYFKGRKNLTRLVLRGTHVTDAGLAYFKDCRKLTILGLFDNAKVSDAGLACFKDCKNLTLLSLWGTHVSDAGLAYFKDCKNLTGLYLSGTQVTNGGLVYLDGLTQLEVLEILGTLIRGPGLKHLRNLVRLKKLELGNLGLIDGDLVHLRSLTALETLGLNGTRVSGPGLANLKGMNQLRDLNLNQSSMTNSGLEHLKNLPQLQKLHLRCPRVTDTGLHYLEGMTNLVELDLSDTKVTAAGVKKLQKSLPACKIIMTPKTP